MLIYLMGKDVDVTNITSEGIKNSSLSLAVFNGNKKMNSVFIQTESLTNNMIGITEYGRMTFNSENTDLSAIIDVSADVDGEIVTKTLSVQSCLDTVEGTELGTGGGGGGGTEYTGENGILVDNTNHVISPDMDVLAEKSAVDAIAELIPSSASITNLLATQADLENTGVSFQPASATNRWNILKVANVYIASCSMGMEIAINQQEGSLYLSEVQTIDYPEFVLDELNLVSLYSDVTIYSYSDIGPVLFSTNILNSLYGDRVIQFRAASTVSEAIEWYNVEVLLMFYIHE